MPGLHRPVAKACGLAVAVVFRGQLVGTMGFRFRRSARLGPLRFHFTASGLSSISLGGRGASLNLPVNRRGGPRTTVGLPGTGLSWTVEQSQGGSPSLGAGGLSSAPLPPVVPGDTNSKRPPARPAVRERVGREGFDSTAPISNVVNSDLQDRTGLDEDPNAWDTADGDTADSDAADGDAGGAAALKRSRAAAQTRAGSPESPTAAALPNSRRLRPSQLEALRRHCLELFEQQLFRPGSEPRRLWDEALVSRLLCDPGLGGSLAGQLALIETPQSLAAYLERSRSQDDLKRRCQRGLAATEEALRLCRQRGWLA